MSETLTPSETQQALKLPTIIDGLSGIGVMGGAIASLVTQQAAFATVPLSLMFMLQIFNRRKLGEDLIASNQMTQQAIQRLETTIQEKLDQQAEKLSGVAVQANTNLAETFRVEGALDYKIKDNRDLVDQILVQLPENLIDRLEEMSTTINSLKEITDAVNLDEISASADAYYKRAINQEQLGNLNAAISDYSRAIECSPNHAWAHFRRGVAKLENGLKQTALIDLNTSAKFFFEAGDLDSYQMAKDKAAEVHSGAMSDDNRELATAANGASSSPASIDEIFGA